jgi:hypothetical protein
MSRFAIPLIFVVIAVPALAQKPRVVIVPFTTGEGATDKATGKFSGLLTDELKSRSDAVELVAPPVTKLAPEKQGSSSRKTPSAEASLALDTGRKAFDDLRFEEAIPALKKGVELMLADAASADFEAVQDALVKIAASNFRNGEEKEAKSALLDLARLAPNYALPAGYPPVFQREFEKAQKRLDKQPRGQVVIEGPSGATAFLDGRDLGMVPATEENVSAGTHYVRVEGTRAERFGQTIELKGALVKVKASFGAAPERTPVNMVPNPNVSASVDEGMAQRLTAYCKAAGADYAVLGLVYRISDTQLQAGTALFNTKKTAFAQLTPVTFDVEVLTANTEAFKLADEVLKRTASFGATASAPFSLVAKKTQVVIVKNDPVKVDPSGEDLSVAGPSRRTTVTVEPSSRVLDKPANVVDLQDPAHGSKPQEPVVAKPPVPVWVWVVVGGVAVVGGGIGGYFGIREATRPVTGTVNASW